MLALALAEAQQPLSLDRDGFSSFRTSLLYSWFSVQDSMEVKRTLPTLAPRPIQLNEAERKELQQLAGLRQKLSQKWLQT